MKKKILSYLFSFIILFVNISIAFAHPFLPTNITDVEILTPSVEQFGKFEAIIELDSIYNNPYDYDEVVVAAYFTSPTALVDSVDGFFMQDFDLNESNGLLISAGTGEFRVRFSPKEIGVYEVVFTVTDSTGTVNSLPYNFTSIEIFDEKNNGFVQVDSTSNYLKFDDNTAFIPIGENMAWQDNNAYLDYRNWLTPLAENGGNFIRLWHAAWGLGIEWKAGGSFQGLRKYKQTNSFYQDWLYDFCAEQGIYVMLALHYHGAVSTTTNANWQDSPYNTVNGGPCQNTIDFFTNEEAKAHTKNRLRYIIARWGYAKNIMCWELFNEVLWTDNYQFNKDLIGEWHLEMAAYLKQIDPNQHIVSTSYGDDWREDEAVWSAPEIEITQSHLYQSSPNLERLLAGINYRFLEEFEKPTLNGEFGLGITSSLTNSDPDGVHIHNAIWGGLFSGGLGTAMTWWWEDFIHPQDLYFHFFGIKEMINKIDFLDRKMAPALAFVSNAPENLNIGTSLNWGGIATDSITISSGILEPSDTQLGQFLYGASWNTQFRSPPVFMVNYLTEGEFSVTTGDDMGMNPTIEIWVDSVLILQDSTVAKDTTYSITIPEGEHIIHVDNKGTDWIKINNYFFEGLGSQIDAYVLTSKDKDYAAGWVLQKKYNHQSIAQNGLPEETPNTFLWINDFVDGIYAIHLFDPLTGDLISSGNPAVAENGILKIPLPPLVWDLTFIVDNSPVSINEVKEDNFTFNIFPNPSSIGGNISVQLESNKPFHFSLIDLMGRTVFEKKNQLNPSLQIPSFIAEGHYWIKIEQDEQKGIQSIILLKDK